MEHLHGKYIAMQAKEEMELTCWCVRVYGEHRWNAAGQQTQKLYKSS